jgi:hypothetical protein
LPLELPPLPRRRPLTLPALHPPPAAPCFGEGLYHLSCYAADLKFTDIGEAKAECFEAFEGTCRACCGVLWLRIARLLLLLLLLWAPLPAPTQRCVVPSDLCPPPTPLAEANPDCPVSLDYMGKYAYGCGKFAIYHFPTLVRDLCSVRACVCVRACVRALRACVLVQERACVSATRSQFWPCLPSAHPACP